MKRVVIIAVIFLGIVYIAEASSITGLKNYKPLVSVITEATNTMLTWSRIPYFPYYEIEIFNHPPQGSAISGSAAQPIARYYTWNNQFAINETFPAHTYWRVSAHGLFNKPLGLYSDAVDLSRILDSNEQNPAVLKPAATSPYPYNAPASQKPMLLWSVVPGAVYYEIEFLTAPPENPNDIQPSRYQIMSSREVFTNGYNADLSFYKGKHLYWRVRALDYNDNPVGVFSDAAELFIDPAKPILLKPLISTIFNIDEMATPLYPVYSWIPILDAASYEVEILNHPPENPNGTTPSLYRIWSKEVVNALDCYDEIPRITPGTYYWRVRGLNAEGKTVGVYSDATPFVVDLSKGNYSATFGDSITHGGGAISYSPADWEYSFQTYLKFATVNLGKSGDTSENMLDRFDRDVLPYAPKYLIIMGGTNSLRGGVPASQVISELSAMRDKCIAHNIRPIFLTLPPINPEAISRAFNEETVPNWREEFDAVNRFVRQQRYYVDLAPHFENSKREIPDYYATDGLHPDMEGKKLMAQIINANWDQVTR